MTRRTLLVSSLAVVIAAATVISIAVQLRRPVAKPGMVRWECFTGSSVCFNPAASEGAVYFGSEPVKRWVMLTGMLPRRCYLQALDARTGTRRWLREIPDRATAAPLVADGTVYAGTWSGYFCAVDAATGRVKWSHQAASSIQASAVLTRDGPWIAFPCRDGCVYVLDRVTGTLKGKYQAGPDLWSGIAVSGDIVFGGDVKGEVYAVNVDTLSELWRFGTGARIANSTPAIAGDTLYIGSEDGNLYALDTATGSEKWRFKTGRAVRTSPCVSLNTLYFGNEGRYLYAVDINSGKEKWRFAALGKIGSSPIVAEGTVYFGSDGGDFYAVESGTGMERWRLNVGRPIKSTPAVAAGVVCFGDWAHSVRGVSVGPIGVRP